MCAEQKPNSQPNQKHPYIDELESSPTKLRMQNDDSDVSVAVRSDDPDLIVTGTDCTSESTGISVHNDDLTTAVDGNGSGESTGISAHDHDLTTAVDGNGSEAPSEHTSSIENPPNGREQLGADTIRSQQVDENKAARTKLDDITARTKSMNARVLPFSKGEQGWLFAESIACLAGATICAFFSLLMIFVLKGCTYINSLGGYFYFGSNAVFMLWLFLSGGFLLGMLYLLLEAVPGLLLAINHSQGALKFLEFKEKLRRRLTPWLPPDVRLAEAYMLQGNQNADQIMQELVSSRTHIASTALRCISPQHITRWLESKKNRDWLEMFKRAYLPAVVIKRSILVPLIPSLFALMGLYTILFHFVAICIFGFSGLSEQVTDQLNSFNTEISLLLGPDNSISKNLQAFATRAAFVVDNNQNAIPSLQEAVERNFQNHVSIADMGLFNPVDSLVPLYMQAGQLKQAREVLVKALEIPGLRPIGQMSYLEQLGAIDLMQKNYVDSADWLRKEADVARQGKEQSWPSAFPTLSATYEVNEAGALAGLGVVATEQNNRVEARRYYEEALSVLNQLQISCESYECLRSDDVKTLILGKLASLHIAEGNRRYAELLYLRQLHDLSDRTLNSASMKDNVDGCSAFMLEKLASLYLEDGRTDAALTCYQKWSKIMQEHGWLENKDPSLVPQRENFPGLVGQLALEHNSLDQRRRSDVVRQYQQCLQKLNRSAEADALNAVLKKLE